MKDDIPTIEHRGPAETRIVKCLLLGGTSAMMLALFVASAALALEGDFWRCIGMLCAGLLMTVVTGIIYTITYLD